MYRVLHERSNITVSFVEHLTFQEKMTSTHSRRVNSDKSKEKQLELGHAEGFSTNGLVSQLLSGST